MKFEPQSTPVALYLSYATAIIANTNQARLNNLNDYVVFIGYLPTYLRTSRTIIRIIGVGGGAVTKNLKLSIYGVNTSGSTVTISEITASYSIIAGRKVFEFTNSVYGPQYDAFAFQLTAAENLTTTLDIESCQISEF